MNKYSQFSKTDEYKKWRACGRKKAYDTEQEAQLPNQRVYQCKYCQRWHRSGSLTTLVNKVKRHS